MDAQDRRPVRSEPLDATAWEEIAEEQTSLGYNRCLCHMLLSVFLSSIATPYFIHVSSREMYSAYLITRRVSPKSCHLLTLVCVAIFTQARHYELTVHNNEASCQEET